MLFFKVNRINEFLQSNHTKQVTKFLLFLKEVLRFVGLKCLYLHANKINDLKEVDKLKSLKHLDLLTLHGNPIENLPIFKHYILSKLPTLRNLNFTGLSKADRQTAVIRLKSNTTPLVVENRKAENESK